MDQKPLVDSAKSDGARLVHELHKNSFDAAAFWFWIPDVSKWRLILATPLIESEGSIKAWEKLCQSWQTIKPPLSLSLDDIWLTTPMDSLVQLLRLSTKTDRGVHGIDFSDNVINGILIHGAYIYRIT